MDIKEGVYSKTSMIKIGTGSTSKKTKSVNYYYAKQKDTNTISVDLLSVNHQPIGFIEDIEVDKFLKEYEFISDLTTFKKNEEKLLPEKIESTEHVRLGDKHLDNKEFNSAEYEYGIALKYDEKNLKAHHGISKVYLETGQTEKAKDILKKMSAIEELYDPENKHIFNELAINLRKQKMYEEAFNNYQKAISMDPNDEILYYNMARAYYDKGELETAIKIFQQALTINPNFTEAKKALDFITRKMKQ